MTSSPRIDFANWNPRQWTFAIGVFLLLTMAPLSWIAWQQRQVLTDMQSNQVDALTWQAFQVEREVDRLGDSVHRMIDDPANGDVYEMQERYEILISRIELMANMPRKDLLSDTADLQQIERDLKEFQTWGDPLFAKPEDLRQQAVLMDLDSRIDSLQSGVGEMTRAASRAVSRFVDERNLQLRQQTVLVLTMAGVNTVGLMVFVGFLITQMRRQQRQNRQLKKLSQELTVAKDAAESANHGKSVFLANMSHEIRTPFQGLLGMLNLLNEGKLTSQQRDYLRTAQDSALHLLGVLNDILDVSTMESGTLKLTSTDTNLHTIVDEVEALMQVAAHEKGLEFSVSVDKDVPRWVKADPTRLRQIMFNLINNAIKFTVEGGITVKCSMESLGASIKKDSRQRFVITVADTGPGMDEETVTQLFTRFFQADNSLRRKVGGTGLGLEISRNLARMMNGDISVQSKPGVGSVFTVTLDLPISSSPSALDDVSSENALLTGKAPRLRILVAEDHPVNLKYMNILLDRMGHSAVFCSNGQEALTLIQREPFDVVLLDYHMPVLDGLAATEAIRKLDGPESKVKIILVTADVVNDTRKRALEVGVDEFASKPLQADDLRRALARCGLLGDFRLSTGFGELSDAVANAPQPGASEQATEKPSAETASQAEAQAPLIDDEAYRELLSMMPRASLIELLGSVFSPPDGTVYRLQNALRANRREGVAHEAHQLKGTAMLVGFRALGELAEEFEMQARQPNASFSDQQAQALMKRTSATQAAMDAFDYPETA